MYAEYLEQLPKDSITREKCRECKCPRCADCFCKYDPNGVEAGNIDEPLCSYCLNERIEEGDIACSRVDAGIAKGSGGESGGGGVTGELRSYRYDAFNADNMSDDDDDDEVDEQDEEDEEDEEDAEDAEDVEDEVGGNKEVEAEYDVNDDGSDEIGEEYFANYVARVLDGSDCEQEEQTTMKNEEWCDE